MGVGARSYAAQVSQAWTILVTQLSAPNPRRLTYKVLGSRLVPPVGPRLVGPKVLGPIQNFCLATGLPDLTVLVGLSRGGGRVGVPGIDFFCNDFGRGYGERPDCGHRGTGTPGSLPCYPNVSVPDKHSTWTTTFAAVRAAAGRFSSTPPPGLLPAPPLPRQHTC